MNTLEYWLRGRGGEGLGQGLGRWNAQVDNVLLQLGRTSEAILTETGRVGRKRIPSSVSGLLFHAAEHTMRHTGQSLVTVRVLCASAAWNPDLNQGFYGLDFGVPGGFRAWPDNQATVGNNAAFSLRINR